MGTFDRAVADARSKIVMLARTPGENHVQEPDPEWQGAIDLGAALTAGLAELQRYLVATEAELATCVLWAAHAHLVNNHTVKLPRSPRLKLESRLAGSGKTTAAEAVSAMCPRPEFMSSYTASSVFRMLQEELPTLVLDEADRSIHQDGEIVTILNAGYRRSTATIRRTVETPDGGFRSEKFNTFCPVIIAGIDTAPPTIQERAIRIMLRRAQAGEVAEHLRDGSSPALLTVRAHLAAWAAAQVEFTEPPLPEWLRGQPSRTADNWCLFLGIAEQAGGRWPDLLRQAAIAELTGEREPSLVERLLTSIKNCFDVQPVAVHANSGQERHFAPDDRERVQTTTLLAFLIAEPGEEWDVANRGRTVTEYFLKTKLRGLLSPPGSSRWHTRQGDRRIDHRGYERHQFLDAWSRYLPPPPPDPSDISAPSDPLTVGGKENLEPSHAADAGAEDATAADAPADCATGADGEFDLLREQPASEAEFVVGVSDGGDGADQAEGERGGEEGGLAVLVRELRTAHPGWSLVKLAKQLGQPPSRIEDILTKAGSAP